jgi:hypothetical protein
MNHIFLNLFMNIFVVLPANLDSQGLVF